MPRYDVLISTNELVCFGPHALTHWNWVDFYFVEIELPVSQCGRNGWMLFSVCVITTGRHSILTLLFLHSNLLLLLFFGFFFVFTNTVEHSLIRSNEQSFYLQKQQTSFRNYNQWLFDYYNSFSILSRQTHILHPNWSSNDKNNFTITNNDLRNISIIWLNAAITDYLKMNK